MSSGEDRDLRLQNVVREILDALDSGETVDDADWIVRHPDLEKEIREILSVQRLLQQDRPGERQRIGDFRIVRPIGRGGMGAVYEAEQISLGRRVALKVLRRSLLTTERTVERFRREAEAVASLAHPGIVAVHAFGEEDDLCYIAMDLVDGKPLDRVLGELASHDREVVRKDDLDSTLRQAEPAPPDGPGAGDPGSSPRTVTTTSRDYVDAGCLLLARVAEAVDHAHAHGIVHRDLKPANILLRRDGAPLVTDFGIARMAEATTLTGPADVVGTIPYMSPERLGGRGDGSDPRADVYALGVTLYETLTFRRPFEAETSEHLMARIQGGAFPSPRKLNPSIPSDVETILRKTLANEPADRYPRAGDLAADLRRYLERQPITARRAGPLLTLTRFAQRSPALAAVAAGLLLSLILGLVITLSLLRTALDEQARAKESFSVALLAVDRMLTRVSESVLPEVPEADPVRRELLLDALSFYRQFMLTAENRADPGLRRELGRAHLRVSHIHEDLGDHAEAEKEARTALSLFEKEAATGSDPEPVLDVATARAQIAILLERTGRAEEADPVYRQTIASLQEIRREHDRPEIQERLIKLLANHGQLLCELRRFEESGHANGQALALLESLVQKSPDDRNLRLDLAECRNQRAVLAISTGRPSEAFEPLHRAVEMLEELERNGDRRPTLIETLVSACNNLGSIVEMRGDLARAEELYRRAIGLSEEVARRHPSVPGHRRQLATGSNNIGLLLKNTDRPDEARPHFERAIELLTALVEEITDEVQLRAQLGGALNNLGALELRAGDPELACELLRQAVVHQTRALETSPDDPMFRAFLCNHHEELALTYLTLGDIEAAREQARRLARTGEEGMSRGFEDPRPLLTAASLLSQCLASLEEEEEPARALDSAIASEALEILDLVRARGIDVLLSLRRDRRFAALRGRDETDAWIEQMRREDTQDGS